MEETNKLKIYSYEYYKCSEHKKYSKKKIKFILSGNIGLINNSSHLNKFITENILSF